ncbi:MAG: hypothetical protein K2J40_05480 [Ruminococcus sp.]|nr:hypothetical protein [Ruminococcus sp.]
MKKALSLLVSSFVALNLAASVITNAAADEPPETADDSIAVTVDTDIQTTAVPIVTTTTTTTTITTTTTVPDDIYIYTTEPTTTETPEITTTVTTENDDEEEDKIFSYRFEIKAIDSSHDEAYLQNVDINMRLVEYDSGYFVLNDKAVNDTFKIKTIAEWNAADVNPMVIDYPDTNVDHVYVVESDELPENYCYAEEKEAYIHRDYKGSSLKNLANTPHDYWVYLIRLYNEPPCEVWDTFPRTVSPEFSIDFLDYTEYVTDIHNVENIPDIEVEIVEAFENENGEFTLGSVIGNYNTSDGEVSFTKECTFNSLNDLVYFGVKTSNLPDYYADSHDTLWYGGKHIDEYRIIPFSAYYIRTRDTNCDIVLRKQDAPIYTTVTTSYPEITTTTTSTEIEDTDTTTSSETTAGTTTITNTTLDVETTTTDTTVATTENNDEELPQTGIPFVRSAECFAVMLIISGAMLVIKSRRHNG